MSFNVDGLHNQRFPSRVILVAFVVFVAVFSASSALAASVTFSGKVFAPADRALMTEQDQLVTFTDQVGIRFRSQNANASPIKLNLSIRDSAGRKIKPVSIHGSPIVKSRQQNLVTLVLPVKRRGSEVFELCLRHLNKANKTIKRTCSNVSVLRYE